MIELADLATIVREPARLAGPALAELDRWAACRAADLADTGLLHLLPGDVADRAGQLRAPGWACRQERRRAAASAVRMQQDRRLAGGSLCSPGSSASNPATTFDGGGMLHADLDAPAFTTVATAVETVAGPPCPSVSRPTQRRTDGGPDDPDNLTLLCRRHHRRGPARLGGVAGPHHRRARMDPSGHPGDLPDRPSRRPTDPDPP